MRVEANDAYAVERDLRVGRYPGKTIATYPSHWKAVEAMLRYNVTPLEEPTDAG